MNLVEFLEDISAQGVELWVEGDRLRYRVPKNLLTPTLLANLKQNKAEILQLLCQQQLTQIWSEVLNVHPVKVQDNFFDLGGNSFLAIRLIADIEQQFGKNLSIATLLQNPTIEQMVTILLQETNSSFWSPLVAIQPSGSKRPFFCVPGVGGNVMYFYDLARQLGSDQPFYGLQALGLDGESEPYTRVEDMASYYIQAIQTIQPQGPYLLGGHSFGGHVAFEMAQQLRKQEQKVALLAILDAKALVPSNKRRRVDWDDTRWLVELANSIGNVLGKDLAVSYEILQPLTWEEQLEYFKEQFVRNNLLPPGVKVKQIRGYLQVYKVNVLTKYMPQDIYPDQITLFCVNEAHPAENVASNELSEILPEDMTQGWDQLSAKPVEVHVVPGNHLRMIFMPHVVVLAEQLKDCLEKAHEKYSSSHTALV